RALIGDGIATMVAGAGGGTGVTTYAENIGVMAVTKIYSTLIFVVAAVAAIMLGFSPKFGALIMTIPGPVLGGLSIVVFGLITATGGRIWVENRVDFSRARNLVTVAVAVTIGAGDLALRFGDFTLGGIGIATFGAIVLSQLLRDDTPDSDRGTPAWLKRATCSVLPVHAPAGTLPGDEREGLAERRAVHGEKYGHVGDGAERHQHQQGHA